MCLLAPAAPRQRPCAAVVYRPGDDPARRGQDRDLRVRPLCAARVQHAIAKSEQQEKGVELLHFPKSLCKTSLKNEEMLMQRTAPPPTLAPIPVLVLLVMVVLTAASAPAQVVPSPPGMEQALVVTVAP
jgi:hypothetical protein